MSAAGEGGVDTRVDLGGIALRNPVLTESGTFGYGSEFAPFFDLEAIGGIVAKSLTLEPHHLEVVPWLVSDIAVKGRVHLELSDGPAAEISAHQSVIFRPEDRRARFTLEPTRDLRLAGFMVSAGRIATMFGDEVPELIEAGESRTMIRNPSVRSST